LSFKKAGIILIIIVLAAAGIFWWQGREEERDITVTEQMVTEVTEGDLQETISASGELQARDKREHSAPRSAEVTEIAVETGDEVEKGDLLFQLDDREQRLDYLQAQRRYNQALIDGSEQQIAEEELQLELAEKRFNDMAVKAKIDGQVGDFDFSVGDELTAESSGITVRDFSSYLVEIDIDEIDSPLLDEGLPAMVDVDALPGNSFSGEVVSIYSGTRVNDGMVVVPVEIEIFEPSEDFRAGFSAEAEIVVESRENVPMVPTTAIFTEEGQEYVVKVGEEEELETVEVSTGLTDRTQIEITSGIETGDRILINAAMFIGFGEEEDMPGFGGPPGANGGPGGGF